MQKLAALSIIVKLVVVFFILSSDVQASARSAIKLLFYIDEVGITATGEKVVNKGEEFFIVAEKWVDSLKLPASVSKEKASVTDGVAVLRTMSGPAICPEDYTPNASGSHWTQTPSESPC